MRSSLCSIQHGLTAEATNIVKQAVSLAKRRGHAQVTPLHVANAMLSSSTGLLKRACLQSHSHPLQCKALELCFNVALNRLPASSASPLLGPRYLTPSLSNALVAAFKRAQAHQRRGSIENQQQPILALKIELEQLIISILDDPSVSRVMREAGFSSTQVKNRVEQAVSLEICSQNRSPSMSSQSKLESTKALVLGTNMHLSPHFSQFKVSQGKSLDQFRSEDVMSVLNELSNKRKRNTVIVGECLASAEGVFRGVMEKFERGDVPGELRYMKFISLPLFSLRNSSKEDVEQKLTELGCLVKSYITGGVVLYLGDLKCTSEFWSAYGEERRKYYCPVEHIIMGLKGLMCGIGEAGSRFWLFGIATFQTYMKCKTGYPSLETIWDLHPLTIPVGSLSLTLNLESNLQAQVRSKVSDTVPALQLLETGFDERLTCCNDCMAKFNREVQSIASDRFCNKETATISTTSSLPSWLRQSKEDRRKDSLNDQEFTTVRDLRKKWNSFCSSGHKHPNIPHKTFIFTSPSPSSTSVSSYERNSDLHQTHFSWPITFEPKQTPSEPQFWMSETNDEGYESNLREFIPERNGPKPDLLSNPNSSPNSASSSEVMEDLVGLQMFRELNAENLKILCDALEKKVSWQKDIIPEIATAILQCRSGKSIRKCNLKDRESKEETWMFFLGVDNDGKEKIARELGKLVFGSQSNFVSVCLSSFSSTRAADSTAESKNKRTRSDELGSSYLDKFGEAVNENPHRVFFMEDVDQIDYCSQKAIKQAIKSGRVILPGGDTVSLMDAIIIFSCESSSSVSRACYSPKKQKHAAENDQKTNIEDDLVEKSPSLSLDLNISIVEDNGDKKYSVGVIEILESVDMQVTFKVQEL